MGSNPCRRGLNVSTLDRDTPTPRLSQDLFRPNSWGQTPVVWALPDRCRTVMVVSGRAAGDEHLAAELTDDLAALVGADRLHRDNTAVAPALRLGLVQNGRLGVDRVAVEGRLGVFERLDLEIGDRLAGSV